ncbi:hypothetical protein D8B25_20015 [Verminephrobacter aporrectodeae subsp. tuberculatae]|nr:hypothetical protein [Verminephrobacter aporrectodeae subsp. tuberculatae]MCW8205001.1 hypothetical protein [Verminephrobacter aporrectodeae subsp. tuberculatae]
MASGLWATGADSVPLSPGVNAGGSCRLALLKPLTGSEKVRVTTDVFAARVNRLLLNVMASAASEGGRVLTM